VTKTRPRTIENWQHVKTAVKSKFSDSSE